MDACDADSLSWLCKDHLLRLPILRPELHEQMSQKHASKFRARNKTVEFIAFMPDSGIPDPPNVKIPDNRIQV